MSWPTSMKELLLIPCSNSKNEGGQLDLKGRTAEENLSAVDRNRLVKMRQELASAFNVNLSKTEGTISPLMPAYRRYSGNLYGQVRDAVWTQLGDRDDVDLGIVSALYGLIYWDEPIVKYNISMRDKVRGRVKLHTWWKRNGLGEVLAEFITSNRYDRIRALLSGDYGLAVRGVEGRTDAEWLTYEYRGLGSGSNYYRGRDINRVLADDVTCPRCTSRSTRRVSKNDYRCNSCSSTYRV